MKETVIQFNTKKQVIILLFAVGLAIAIFFVGIYPMFLDHQIRFFSITFFLISCWLVSKGLMSVFSKDKAGLIINSNGIHSKVTSVGKKIGFIPWEDVERLGTTILMGSSFISIVTNKPERYRNFMFGEKGKKEFDDHHIIINISAQELDIDYEKLKNLLEQYFNASR